MSINLFKNTGTKTACHTCVSSTILDYLYYIYIYMFSLTQYTFNHLELMLIQHHVLSLNTVQPSIYWNSVFRVLWLATQTQDIQCYSLIHLTLKQQVMPNMFMNKLETKSNGVLIRMVSNTERIPNSFGRNVPAKAKQRPSNVVFVGRKRDGREGICMPKL